MQELLNTIILGRWEDWLPKLPDNSIDMALLDLPYNTTQADWDKQPVNLPLLWKELIRVGKSHTSFVFTASQPFTTDLICSNRKMFRYEIIWSKTRVTGFLDANRRPLKAHESILIFSGTNNIYNPQRVKGKKHKIGGKAEHDAQAKIYGSHANRRLMITDVFYPTSIVEFGPDPEMVITKKQRPAKIPTHPTQKPVKLFEYLIRTFSNPGQLILDPTAGSGTTALAAYATNRNFICIEQDATYHARAVKRLEQARVQLRFDEMVG